ncbi:MAG: radical SAM protein [Candidatus Omnitrophota bacterium]
MVDVILIHSPIILYKDEKEKEKFRGHGGDEKSFYPTGILYMAAFLERFGHSVKIIDVAPEGITLPDILQTIKNEKPMVVGISSMTTSIASAVSLAKAIKEKFGDSFHLGLGGVHLCCDKTFLERFPVFDFGIIGEGEHTFEEIVSKIKKGEKVRGPIIGKITEDLDSLPFPARHLIKPEIYLREEQMKYEVPSAGILGSRGCPFKCIFCCIPVIGFKLRLRSAKNIVDEMEQVYDQCQGSYGFNDDCFTLNKKYIMDFCQEVIDRKLKIKFIASTRASVVDDEVAKALRRAGCYELYFGVESGNERIRNEIIKKKVDDQQITKAVELCRKYRIMSNLFLMVGFPTETRKEMLDTVKIGSKVKADVIGIHITMPFPGTEVFNYAIKHKMIPEDIIDKYASGELGKGFRGIWPLFIPKGSTLEDLVNIKKMAYRRFFINPMWLLRRIRIWFLIPRRFKEDLKLFKIAFYVFMRGGTKGQLS